MRPLNLYSLLLMIAVTLVGHYSQARHYNVIDMNCTITGEEVSLTPTSQPGSRLRKYTFPDSYKFKIRQMVYVSDAVPEKAQTPISFSEMSVVDQGDGLVPEPIDSWFVAPTQLTIALQNATTTVFYDFGRDTIVALLEAMGSQTATAFNEELKDFQFTTVRYFRDPTIWKDPKPRDARSIFQLTGWYGEKPLEICYQIDPIGLDAPDDPFLTVSLIMSVDHAGSISQKVRPRFSSRPSKESETRLLVYWSHERLRQRVGS